MAKHVSTNAFKKMHKAKDKINEKNFTKYLQTKGIPDPDLLIRTGNTNRLSNFLLWQISYTEIFFEKKLWPDFNEKDYYKIIKKYKNIKLSKKRIGSREAVFKNLADKTSGGMYKDDIIEKIEKK